MEQLKKIDHLNNLRRKLALNYKKLINKELPEI